MTKIHLIDCPFCGFKPDEQNDDCIYPVNRERTVYNLVCYETGGGCGASVLGSDAMDCIDRWNNRKGKKYPIVHTNPKIPGSVVQYDDNVFIWHTLDDALRHREPEMRVANSLKRAWAHLASHLRIRGVL
jgi:hypothetical protein